MDIKELKTAIKNTNSCQRNWDRSKVIPEEHVNLFVEAIKWSPTKQNETHYKVVYTTNPELIYKIYKKTKYFTVVHPEYNIATDDYGNTKDEYNVCNSQTYSNLLIGIFHDWKQENSRAMIHKIVDERSETVKAEAMYQRAQHRLLSMGVVIGEIVLTASLLGYKTGLCSAHSSSEVGRLFGEEGDECIVLVGVGYPDLKRNRKEHEETYNRDIPDVGAIKTGAPDEKWLFPTFHKEVSCKRIS